MLRHPRSSRSARIMLVAPGGRGKGATSCLDPGTQRAGRRRTKERTSAQATRGHARTITPQSAEGRVGDPERTRVLRAAVLWRTMLAKRTFGRVEAKSRGGDHVWLRHRVAVGHGRRLLCDVVDELISFAAPCHVDAGLCRARHADPVRQGRGHQGRAEAARRTSWSSNLAPPPPPPTLSRSPNGSSRRPRAGRSGRSSGGRTCSRTSRS